MAAVLVLLPLVYLLSIGPVAKTIDALGLSRGPAKQFYAPLIWLHDHTPLRRPLELYLSAWGVK
ncbi:MAG: hypothetical protein JNJ54_26510 [Myxococcaceae bacterium]|nr:hypothetical protein [Myxococcaceae bacterium]